MRFAIARSYISYTVYYTHESAFEMLKFEIERKEFPIVLISLESLEDSILEIEELIYTCTKEFNEITFLSS